ncbi:MAG: ribokinase [Burkholderiaceae bacterium]
MTTEATDVLGATQPAPQIVVTAVAPQIVVFGSLNMDAVLRVPRAPQGGETLHGHSLTYLPGGKGGNQAVACARMGARVSMLGQVGADAHGLALRTALEQDGIDCSGVAISQAAATGAALVMVDDAGQNRIVVIGGANAGVTLDEAALAQHLATAAFLVMQLEVPVPAVLKAARLAQRAGCKVLLNPSPIPAEPLPDGLWPLIDTVVVNEVEAQALTGRAVDSPESAALAALALRALGPERVVVTLGALGAVAAAADGCYFYPALAVKALDTTAAGDTFLGALAAGLAQGSGFADALALGNRAAAWCVQHAGAQPAIPSLALLARVAAAPVRTRLDSNLNDGA